MSHTQTYKKAAEDLEEYSTPGIGYYKDLDTTIPRKVGTSGDRILIRKNNTIIEILEEISRKLDILIIERAKQKRPDLDEALENINKNLSALALEKGSKTVKVPPRRILTWNLAPQNPKP
ncbi:hypothetical protein E2542_SST24686 [Spatholobus suberectus]|nr:hypothetical protein E2542_SST24686 [Spatholobus suberectus]